MLRRDLQRKNRRNSAPPTSLRSMRIAASAFRNAEEPIDDIIPLATTAQTLEISPDGGRSFSMYAGFST
jgi:hypothetical protein